VLITIPGARLSRLLGRTAVIETIGGVGIFAMNQTLDKNASRAGIKKATE
jgi:hypothetical protein